MKKSIIIGFGLIIALLILAGSADAKLFYAKPPYPECSYCHTGVGTEINSKGIYFNATHKFDGQAVPINLTSCTTCHTDITSFLPLTSTGQSYNSTHRYNSTTLASVRLAPPACANCHVDVISGNFTLLTGTPYYLKSTTCENCHRAKYDNWTNTTHAVMLTPASKAQAMGLPENPIGWPNTSYVVVTKFALAYINTTGYFPAQNDTWNTETQEWENGHNSSAYGTCGRCHTTNWNASARNLSLPGFSGTFSEPGIACERCHGPGGNGHQVTVNYSATLCTACHTGGNHGTGWEDSEHVTAIQNRSSCLMCHSPFDLYNNAKNNVSSVPMANETAQACGVCHNAHDITDSKYAATLSNSNDGPFDAATWSVVADAKLSFFNATASSASVAAARAAGSRDFLDMDIFDNLSAMKGSPPQSAVTLNLTGKPLSEKLCSMCHYHHNLAHTTGVNLTHGTLYYGQSNAATCTDCHMRGANATVGKDMMKQHSNDIFLFANKPNSSLADPANSCGSTTSHCHTASSQNLSASSHSMVPIFNEWSASAHNDKVVSIGGAIGNHFYGTFNATTGFGSAQANTCLQCKSPKNWNPTNKDNVTKINLTDFQGISCMVCHDIHDMGGWLNKTGKAYAWFNKTSSSTGTYEVMANTTQLCGNCHDNIRAGNTGPGWKAPSSSTAKYLIVDNQTPVGTHGVPAADVFAGSWKQTGLLNFECIDCHFSTMTNDANGSVLPDSQKVGGHSFKVNLTLLQNGNGTQTCSTCHVTGTALGNLSTTIANVQAKTQATWNSTNATLISAMVTVNASGLEKNLSKTKIAQAYWDLSMVSTEGSWGVHNPTMDSQLLDDASRLANEANASLGQKEIVSRVQLKAGKNLVSLNGTPAVTSAASVMDSVKNNITIVWGYNASAAQWELYDPSMTPASLNTLKNILPPPKAYFIYAKTDVEWTT